jgi:tRNA uridine 5-carbamoylmethylation protein Kti12
VPSPPEAVTEPRVLILTGAPGVGKTTTARLLSQRFERGVHFESDLVFNFITAGFVEPWLPESQRQNEVVMRTIGATATSYAAGGYFTVVDGIVIPSLFLPTLRDACATAGVEAAYAILRAPLAVCLERVAGRPDHELSDAAVTEQLWHEFTDLGEFEPHALAVDGMNPDEVADVLAQRLAAGELRI